MNTNQVREHDFRSRLGEEFAQYRTTRAATDWLLLIAFAAIALAGLAALICRSEITTPHLERCAIVLATIGLLAFVAELRAPAPGIVFVRAAGRR